MKSTDLILSNEEKNRLSKIVEHHKPDTRKWKHCKIILLLASGLSAAEVAARLKIHPSTIYLWAKRYRELGIDSLGGLSSKNPRLIEDRTRLELRVLHAILSAQPPNGRKWTCKDLILRYGGSPREMARIWKKYDLKNNTQKLRLDYKEKASPEPEYQPSKDPRRVVFQRDIAADAGVSQQTVSLVLRNDSRITGETAQKVWDSIHKLGYRSDPLLSKLMAQIHSNHKKQYSPVLAVLSRGSDNLLASANDPRLFSMLEHLKGMRLRAQERGYTLEEIWVDDPLYTHHRINRILVAKNIQGLIVLGSSSKHPDLLPKLDWSSFATVQAYDSVDFHGFPRIHVNHFRNMQLTLNNLINLGYQRIGFIHPPDWNQRLCHAQFAAYMAYQANIQPENRLPIMTFSGESLVWTRAIELALQTRQIE